MGVEITVKTDLEIRSAKRREDPRGFAIDAIGRLDARRSGRPSDDAWIDYAIGQWRAFLSDLAREPRANTEA